MINCLCKKTTMSLPEFLQLERGEITLEEIRVNHKTECILDNIKKNKRLEKCVVTFMASALYAKEVLAADKSGIDILGWKILNIIREWAHWILLIMCIVEIIRCATSGEIKSVYKVIIKFALIFASMYLIPELFNTIAETF